MTSVKKHTVILIFLFFLSGIPDKALFSQVTDKTTNTTEAATNTTDDSYDENFFNDTSGLNFKLTGKYKNLFSYQKTDRYSEYLLTGTDREKELVSNLNRIRLTPELTFSDMLLIHVDVDNELIFSSFNQTPEFEHYWTSPEYNSFMHLSWNPHNTEDIYYRIKLLRAFAKFTISDFSITLGRQQIRFGSGRLWNPLDILNPISPTALEGPEEQKGTDALKVDYYLNDTTEFTFVYSPLRYYDSFQNFQFTNGNSVARAKTSILDTDLALLGGWIARRLVAGLDIASTVFDGTLRGCILYSNPENDRWYFQINSGYEYTFKNGVYFLFEYFYNQNGMNYNSNLLSSVGDYLTAGVNQGNYYYISNQLITFNKHYTGLALGYDFLPLLHGDIFTIYDFQGRGLFTTFSLKYNIMENLDVTGGIMVGHVFENAIKSPSDFQEFDHNMYYTTLELYF